jgi:hypothetical protein
MKLSKNETVVIELCPCCSERLLVDTATGALARLDKMEADQLIRGELRPSGIVVEHATGKQ